jgi:D-glycero-D-manno-heptose 1,7-bisphosphate phosphatase
MSNKAIFLDRDDTLIEDPGYINHPDQVKLLDGVADALRELKEMGYKLVVISNQSAVARGIVTEEALGEIHNRLRQLLAEKGTFLDQIYYCPYHPDGVIPKYRKESDWRKPNPGMLLAAADEMDIDLSQSWSIGDNQLDVEAGSRAGCKTILIDHSPHLKQSEPGEATPDYRAVNIKEAVNIIKRYHRSAGEITTNKPSQNRQSGSGITALPDEGPGRQEQEIPRSFDPSTPLPSTKLGTDRAGFAPRFALNGRASDFAKASSFANATEDRTPDKSQGKQDRCARNDILSVESSSLPQTETVASVSKTDLQTAEPILQVDEPVSQADEPVLQAVEEPSQPEPEEPEPDLSKQPLPDDRTIQLLDAILGQLKSMQRANMFVGEFSITRLMAGIVQIGVLFCLLVTIGFLISPTRQDNSVLIALGFAAVLQMMALTLYIMQGRK